MLTNNSSTSRICDGNEAAASIAYRCNDVIGIYPITPSSPMAEWCEEWSHQQQHNIRGIVPTIFQMQSEGGAAGLLHGALNAGALATSFTSSQGLLLMIPNMYKIAGELTPFVLHVAARTLATHALSIFCDHSDVMAARQTGFAMLCSNNVQQAHDFALIAQSATLKSRVPFMHFFDGFRTSHELNHLDYIDDDTLKLMLDQSDIEQNFSRRLSPDVPSIRGTAHNPDTYFQAREAINPYYQLCPDSVIDAMNRFAQITGRRYQPYQYIGASDATDVIVVMGSACSTVQAAVEKLNAMHRKVGVLCVHLFRPFSIEHCIQAIPDTIRRLAVLDRTKEPGSVGEPLYLDMVAAVNQAWRDYYTSPMPRIFGGRYGLSSKEFTPADAECIFDTLESNALWHDFTVGINDDVTQKSLTRTKTPSLHHTSPQDAVKMSAIFYGRGSDGTVGASKNAIKIVGQSGKLFSQGYFVYDSKKSGGMTVSHLRFDDKKIDAPYLIEQADYIGIHQLSLLNTVDALANAKSGAIVVFNSHHSAQSLWQHLGHREQQHITSKSLKVFTIDAQALAFQAGISGRINSVMQRAFFLLTDLISADDALEQQFNTVKKSYQSRGEAIINANISVIEQTEAAIRALNPSRSDSTLVTADSVSNKVSFSTQLIKELIHNNGDNLPVSLFPVDGQWPTATSKLEKRSIGLSVPIWNADACTQCNVCSLVCPHSAIRSKVVRHSHSLDNAPIGFKVMPYALRDFAGENFTIQVSPQDCTGCQLCVSMCPSGKELDSHKRALTMVPMQQIPHDQQTCFEYFTKLPELKPIEIKRIDARSSQLLEPLFEFSGACSGCGETPYIKLLTQLYGDRMMIANATGCSSIYSGNLPTTPYTTNKQGKGPAWSNSLFEDNAEYGLGMRLAIDSEQEIALNLLDSIATTLPADLYQSLQQLSSDSSAQAISQQQQNVTQLKRLISESHPLYAYADSLVAKSVWIIGGDGWAYDIGFGGLDHVLASNKNVNILVLNNQVYANTGGQQSKATPTGAVAKFASEGKENEGKDLGVIAMMTGNAYVASIALGANMNQTLKAIQEAEAYPGPSLIIAYASCITHGITMSQGIEQHKLLVDAGLWQLYRFDPQRKRKGKAPLQIDSQPAKHGVQNFVDMQNRFTRLAMQDSEHSQTLIESLQAQMEAKQNLLNQLTSLK